MKNIFLKTDFSFSEKSESEETGRITGYASVFGVKDSYDEIVEAGAFDGIINDIKNSVASMPLMLGNHEHYSGCPIGIWDSLEVDSKGLKISGIINTEIQLGKEIYSSLKFAKDNNSSSSMGLSIGYYPDWDKYVVDKEYIGHIFSVKKLPEVSIVNFPANTQAVVTDIKRDCLIEEIKKLSNIRELERFLRDSGNFSKKEAETLISVSSTLINSKCDTSEDVDINGYMSLLNRLNQITRNQITRG